MNTTNNLYYYKAVINKIIDGDTISLNIDLGFKIFWKVSCRLAGINTPELNATDPVIREAAIAAKMYVESVLKPGDIVIIKSQKLDKYGRPVIELYYSETYIHLNKELLDKGLATLYF